jgi:triphosphoribosyl-dephospho-CoA synthase
MISAHPLTADGIGSAFLSACRAELESLKPGNVHVFGDGHRMDVAMFLASARAAAPHIADRTARLGERIERAVAASMDAAGCNTNLGIILLCVPLAAAAERGHGPLRVSLDAVLDDLDIADAQAVYRAISLANPAGLGSVPAADVGAPPDITLLQAMTLARGHDRIANAYASDFADIFDFALPALTTARISAETPQLAVTTLHMCLLDQFPDTHIARKFGRDTAAAVQRESHQLRTSYRPAASAATFDALLAFDASLKARGLNPGTTADFVVATLFADRLLHADRDAKTV